MSRIPDPITMRHPALPRRTVVVSRLAFKAHAKRGWVEVKSSEAKTAVETSTEPTAPSQED